jgi:hypothetical protein
MVVGVMKNILVYILFAALFILITLFGLGPAVFADGVLRERLFVLSIVLLLYAVLVYLLIKYIKRK